MAEAPEHTHTATNGRAEFTLDELAELHGGLAPWMMLVSQRTSRAYVAAKAKNARLARFQISEATKLLRSSAKVRPQYTEAVEKFITEQFGGLRKIIEAEDWDNFDAAWEAMTVAINENHEEFDHGFLVWKVDPSAAGDLDVTPRAQ
jgi:hypothetical protein